MATKKFGTAPLDERRWNSVIRREQTDDAPFVYAVKTTGVFCRPGCASRLPRRENVLFFDNPATARGGGFRPCKRCRPEDVVPLDEQAAAVRRACRMLEEREATPLAKLAAAAGYSPPYFQRVFKRLVGVTPRAYAAQQRAQRAGEHLQNGATVTAAVYAAGYSTGSRFYEDAAPQLGMRPAELLNGACGQTIQAAITETELGLVIVAATERGVCAIELGDDMASLLVRLRERFPWAEIKPATDRFRRWVTTIAASIERPKRGLSLPLDIQGTAFQRRVWEALRKIPAGSTTTYARLAAVIGEPRAVRAVAGACAANRLAVAIPCHRVVRSDGNLSGYRWGVERKRTLLEREL